MIWCIIYLSSVFVAWCVLFSIFDRHNTNYCRDSSDSFFTLLLTGFLAPIWPIAVAGMFVMLSSEKVYSWLEKLCNRVKRITERNKEE